MRLRTLRRSRSRISSSSFCVRPVPCMRQHRCGANLFQFVICHRCDHQLAVSFESDNKSRLRNRTQPEVTERKTWFALPSASPSPTPSPAVARPAHRHPIPEMTAGRIKIYSPLVLAPNNRFEAAQQCLTRKQRP